MYIISPIWYLSTQNLMAGLVRRIKLRMVVDRMKDGWETEGVSSDKV